MKKYILWLIGLSHICCYSADYTILECKELGMVPSTNYCFGRGVDCNSNQRAAGILQELRKAVIRYPELNKEQKNELFIAISRGLKNNFQNSEIGSGNIVLFSAFSRMRNYMITDLLEEKSMDAVSQATTKDTNVQLTSRQLIKMLETEYKINNQNDTILQSDIILANLPALKEDKTLEFYPHARFLPSPYEQSANQVKTFFQLLEEADVKSILLQYSSVEIENTVAFSALSLLQTADESNKTLAKTYLALRNSMNPLQKEIFGFTSEEYKTGSPQRYVVLDLRNLTKIFLKSSSAGIPANLKYYLKIDN
jgi:hypothetical protein